jgi:hypothetical protein
MKPDCLPFYLKWQKLLYERKCEDAFLSFVVNLLILIELLILESRESHEMAKITYGGEMCFRKNT